MLFDTVTIVGVGLIGGSIGLALRERRLARRVVGVGRRAASLREAKRLGAIDHGTTSLRRGVANTQLVILCTPVDQIIVQAVAAAKFCPRGTILTDSGSTKANIVARLESDLPAGVPFVGSHPLAGSEKSGVAVAHAKLFDDRVCVITKTAQTSDDAIRVVEQFWQALGSRVIRMSPESHDQAIAYTSHLPHLVAAALSIGLPEKYNDVVASGFRDTTRIAASDPDLWSAIFLENAEPLLDALARFDREVRRFRRALERRDRQLLRRMWLQSKTARQAVSGSNDDARS